MKNKKRKILLSIILGLLFILFVVPLIIPIPKEDNLSTVEARMTSESKLVTIPFDGTDGIDVHYTFKTSEEHPERTYILIHGSLYNQNTWNQVTDYFSTKGNVLAYDQLPYGLTEKLTDDDWTSTNPFTTEAAVTQLISLMDTLSVDTGILVGSSFGGVLAVEAALNYPDRVDELILVDPALLVVESMPEWLLTMPQIDRLGPLFSRMLAKGDGFYESTYYDPSKLSIDRMALNKQESEVINWDISLWSYLKAWAITPSDLENQLSALTQPTLVISGDSDKIVPVEQSIQIAAAIKGSDLIIIEDCGHLPHEEKPTEFIEAVQSWLKKKDSDQ